MGLPSKNDLAGALATKTQVRTAMGLMWEYLAGLLGTQSPTTPLTDDEKQIARDSLGVGSTGAKNRLINGNFIIDQRNAGSSASITAGAAIKYCVDRWYVTCAGANIAAQQVAGIKDQLKSFQLTGASGCTATMMGQRIESFNAYDLKNKSVTVSLIAKASVAKTVSWSAYYANTVDNFSTKVLIATGSLSVTTTADEFQFTFNAGANAGNGIAIEFAAGSLGAGETIAYDQIQLEKATSKTQFESRLFGHEVAMCQRYYEIVLGVSTQTKPYYNEHYFKVPKRAVPTLAVASGVLGGADYSCDNVNALRSPSSVLATGTTGWTMSVSAEL